MTPVELSRTVLWAVRRAVDEGELHVQVPERADVTPPGPGGCGDYATNIALQLARPAGRPPQYVAGVLQAHLLGTDGVTDVVVTGPGFLNISLGGTATAIATAALVEEILRRGTRYGHARGPSADFLPLACPREVRAVVVMDALARILRSQGAAVSTRCEGEIAPEWVDILGVRVDDRPKRRNQSDRAGQPRRKLPAPLHYSVRPVPAPVDPLPLGRDAARWALLHPAAHDRPRITDEHLVQRESNPLFRVRYAHARTRALSRNAADLGFTAEPGDVRNEAVEPGDARNDGVEPGAGRHGVAQPSPGRHDVAEPGAGRPHVAQPGPARHEGVELRDVGHHVTALLADHPRVLAQAAAQRSPDRLARHLVSVADAVLPLLPAVLPRGAEKPSAAHRARLALAEAAGAVLAGGLSLLGIDAPDHL
ncbi:ArgS-related anticodon-binding protein NrtL [Streptomyces sp. NPDC059010]|uniref:ArgS-related anticodon-binding protein NrtL n=1 Tax=Streptomyces sp. NPDC059010 TaxID=3346695 RepID=UPI0036A31A29